MRTTPHKPDAPARDPHQGSLAGASGLHENGVLVIGYGNDLRGDDAVGRRAAETVAGWNLPGVEALSVHQLTPELAERLVGARQVIFVDASVEGEQVAVCKVQPTSKTETLGHTSDPCGLLALVQTLYGQCPPAWLVGIPVFSTALGERLSQTAERGLQSALEQLQQLLSPKGTACCGASLPQHARGWHGPTSLPPSE